MLDLLIEVTDGIGTITLNRPKALNALNLDMVRLMHQTLKEWENDDLVKVVLVQGTGEKAFCAGGDIRSLYESVKTGQSDHMTFFAEEFDLNQYIYQYPKPYIALMTGYVMGGGMGISQGASFRIVTPQSKISMPEVGIGYFPDVGGSYFLSRCPGLLGLYLGITGVIASGEDAVAANLADWIIPLENIPTFIAELHTIVPLQEDQAKLEKAILKLLQNLKAINACLDAPIKRLEVVLEKHFKETNIDRIILSLQQESQEEWIEWRNKTLEKMYKQSPLSMAVTQRLIQLGKHKTLTECFQMEYSLIPKWMEFGDFLEGVRAVIIDKDNQPKWRNMQGCVTEQQINFLFSEIQ